MALNWFRHWFGQRIIANKGYNADDGGYSLYKVIAAGGDAYMDKSILNQFHGMFPMTKKALNVLENHLLEIKECMSEWVEKSDLLKSNCQLNVQAYPVDYITFIEFDNGDFPWLLKVQQEEETLKRGRRLGGNDITLRNLEAARRHQEQREVSVGSDDGLENDVEDEDEDEESNEGAKRARTG